MLGIYSGLRSTSNALLNEKSNEQEAEQRCDMFPSRWVKNDSEMKWLKISR